MQSLEEPPSLVLKQIEHMEGVNNILRRVHRSIKPHVLGEVRNIETQSGFFPPLPPRLPRPQYALTANSLDLDEDSLKFYLSCERGDLSAVISFLEKDGRLPKQAVRQYGLEQAAINIKPEVARYLLENGTILHSSCFMRSIKIEQNSSGRYTRDACIFDKCDNNSDEDSLFNSPFVALCGYGAASEHKVVEFLLANGADPNLGRFPQNFNGKITDWAMNRQSPNMLNHAVALSDQWLLELLLRHGARPDCKGLNLLHSLVRRRKNDFQEFRRPIAEFILDRGLASVNEVKPMPWRHEGTRYYAGHTEDDTPLTYACAASDWDFVEWLLKHGADPDALDRKGYKEQWWCNPYDGPNNPTRLTELVMAELINNSGKDGEGQIVLPERAKKI